MEIVNICKITESIAFWVVKKPGHTVEGIEHVIVVLNQRID